MKRFLLPIPVLALLLLPASALAVWIGFDAGTNELVDVETDAFPEKDQIVAVTDVATETKDECLVRSIQVNGATVELAVACARSGERLLVMPPF